MHPVLSRFEQIVEIPHGSYNEKALGEFVTNCAHSRGLEAVQDETLNVLIRVPGSVGYESSPAVILQGHLDMVCEKAAHVSHDFLRDPISLVCEGDDLRADGTTLGADNAIAISYALALLDDPSPHPPLELLLTVEEEVSMNGVKSFDPAFFAGRRLINLDSAGEGMITVSCAGGIGVDLRAKLRRGASVGQAFALTVNGLKGGHSGGEIHMERGNANMLLMRVLRDLCDRFGIGVESIHGGTKSNAIPISAMAMLAVAEQDVPAACERVEGWNQILKAEYQSSDPDVCVSLSKTENKIDSVFEREPMLNLLGAASLIASGPIRRDLERGIVIASNSIGIVRTQGDELLIQNNLRANLPSLQDEMVGKLRLLADAFGLAMKTTTPYPGWPKNPDSPLLMAAMDAWRETRGENPKVIAIHAGLEVGYIAEKLPGLDAISFGPNTTGAHTIEERLSVSSFVRTYEYLLSVLKRLK